MWAGLEGALPTKGYLYLAYSSSILLVVVFTQCWRWVQLVLKSTPAFGHQDLQESFWTVEDDGSAAYMVL
jgi:hypothetical protein